MSTKNNRILNPDGGRYPFKVSDEYFDNLTARIMKQIPEENAQNGISGKEIQEEVSERNKKIIDLRQRRFRNRWLSVVSIAAGAHRYGGSQVHPYINHSGSTSQRAGGNLHGRRL